jgi:hypothetical protein
MVVIESPDNSIMPVVQYVNDYTNTVVAHGPGEFDVVGPRGGTNAAIVDAQDQVASVKADVAALRTDVDAVGTLVSGVQSDLQDLRSKVGNNTKAFCPEGSVRQDGQGQLQMYVTLFSDTGQAVRVDYITNAGTFGHDQTLVAGVRFTDDANAFLTGPGGPLAGRTDIDSSVRVTSPAPVFLACPVYFDRQIGVLGQVSGGTVQDGNHN